MCLMCSMIFIHRGHLVIAHQITKAAVFECFDFQKGMLYNYMIQWRQEVKQVSKQLSVAQNLIGLRNRRVIQIFIDEWLDLS